MLPFLFIVYRSLFPPEPCHLSTMYMIKCYQFVVRVGFPENPNQFFYIYSNIVYIFVYSLTCARDCFLLIKYHNMWIIPFGSSFESGPANQVVHFEAESFGELWKDE